MRHSTFVETGIAAALVLFAVTAATSASAETVTPTTQASSNGTLNLSAGLSHGYLPVQASQKIHSRLQITADDVRTDGRAPLNLAVVIDHSGSMSDGKLEQAKRAARTLVGRLSEGDRLAVVSYGSSVSVDSTSRRATPANKERLRSAISSIRRRGGTFLAGGFRKGKALVQRQASEETIDRVILLSDGKANNGLQTARALGGLAENALGNGISTTTMGIGLNYDESIMTSMAEMGAGHHYFIEDENRIASMFGEEFESLAGVVARDAYVVLQLGEGVELLDVHGFSFNRRDGNVVVNLGAFHARQNRDVLIDLAASSGPAGSRDILDANLHYDDVTGKSDESVTASATLTAVGTDDATKHENVNESVMRRVEQVRYAQNVDEATKAYDRGDRDKAEEILDKQRERLRTRGDELGFDDAKIQGKAQELEKKKRKMKESGSSSSSAGERLKKEEAAESLDVMRDSAAF